MKSTLCYRMLAVFTALSVALPSFAVDKAAMNKMADAEARNAARWAKLGEKLEQNNPKLVSDLTKYKLGSKEILKSLGEQANDLVFVPTTPCRAVETRDIGGPFVPNEKRSYDLAGSASTVDFTDQVTGGLSTPCNATSLNSDIAGAVPAAALVAISVLSPSIQGYANVWAFGGTEPVVATMLFSNDTFNSSFAVVPFCQSGNSFCSDDIDFKLYGATAHVAIDVYGYFARPAATPLDCVTTATTDTPVASGATANSFAPACATGYTQTSTNCESSTWQMPFVFFKNGTCSAQNNSAAAATLRSSRTCCRVPGR